MNRKRKHENDGEELKNMEDGQSDETTKQLQQKLLQSKDDEEKEMRLWDTNPTSTLSSSSSSSTDIFTAKDEDILLNSSWKEVKKCPDKTNKNFFESLAKEINNFYRMKHLRRIQVEKEQYEREMNDMNKRLPTAFRVDDAGIDSDSNHENVFYVQIPIAVVHDGRFQMVAHPDFITKERLFLSEDECEQIRSQYSVPISIAKGLEFKPSLTKCIIQKTGLWNGHQVTKILLQPRTGRR